MKERKKKSVHEEKKMVNMTFLFLAPDGHRRPDLAIYPNAKKPDPNPILLLLNKVRSQICMDGCTVICMAITYTGSRVNIPGIYIIYIH